MELSKEKDAAILGWIAISERDHPERREGLLKRFVGSYCVDRVE